MKKVSISIVNDSIFNHNHDAIVIPRSTTGTISEPFINGLNVLKAYKYKNLKYQSLGNIEVEEIYTPNSSDGKIVIIYATSVDNNRSELKYIADISHNIINYIKNKNIKSIGIPLLGTGAGGLDHEEIFDLYNELFSKIENKNIYIYVANSYIYQKIITKYNTQSQEKNTNIPYNNYWLIKLNPKSWKIDSLYKGTEHSFHATYVDKTTNLNTNRVEYNLYHKVREHDKIIGYAMAEYHCVVCIFIVTKAIENNNTYGEKISLIVDEVISPQIPFDAFKKIVEKHDEHFRDDSMIRLIEISEEIFYGILSSSATSETNYDEAFNPSQFEFRDNNVDPVLGVIELAKKTSEIMTLIASAGQGNMFGIFGKWGRGKSYFIKHLWNELKKKTNYIKIDFQAWKYQDTPANWAYLYEQFSEGYFTENKKWHDKVYRRIRLNLHRLDEWKIVYFFLTVLIMGLVSFAINTETKVKIIRNIILYIGGGIVFLKVVYFLYKYGGTARNLFSEYYSKVTFSRHLGTQAEIQKELILLIKVWSKLNPELRIVLFVEDIDRCPENSVIDIVDSLRVILEDSYISSKVFIVAAIDERILQSAIQIKYKKFLEVKKNETTKIDELINEYFDKLFIFGLKLGDLSDIERDEYFLQLTKNDREPINNTKRENNETSNLESEKEITNNEEENSANNPQLNSESGSETSLNIDENENNIISDNKLKPLETEILRKALRSHREMTPRQIRIFYYRYILLKNILLLDYNRVNSSNPWKYSKNSELMVDLLLVYSQPGKKKELFLDMTNALKNPNVTVEIKKDQTIKTIDYYHLLRALDVVIAY